MTDAEVEEGLQSPGAGPSRSPRRGNSTLDTFDDVSVQEEERERDLFLSKREEHAALDQSVKSSTELLTSLASYLSTFQTDLSQVSGQISDLQQRSADIDVQLKGRKTIIPALNALIRDITIPPSLITTIRDTRPGQNPDLWLSAIVQLEEKITAIKARGKVKAVQDTEREIIDGLRAKAINEVPTFLLSLVKPLRSVSSGLSTNLPVLQAAVLLKYRPFYLFLLRNSPKQAKQIERGYVNASRAYFETGMRRYCRALTQIKAKGTAKSITTPNGSQHSQSEHKQTHDRLRFAEISSPEDDKSVVLAYMADDVEYTEPLEGLFRSLSLVLLDNASAEFTFIVRFFTQIPSSTRGPSETPTSPLSPMKNGDRARSVSGRSATPSEVRGLEPNMKEAERIWHEVLDPALEYTSRFVKELLAPTPPTAVQLLIMIRLNDALIETCEARGITPLMPYLLNQRLAMWPVYRKDMDQQVESLKKMADSAEGKGFSGLMTKSIKDSAVRQAAIGYAVQFSCMVILAKDEDATMLFSSMTQLRNEIVRLTQLHSAKVKSESERYSFISSIYEIVMHELVSGPGSNTHPRLQTELSFFRTREEEARRKISA